MIGGKNRTKRGGRKTRRGGLSLSGLSGRGLITPAVLLTLLNMGTRKSLPKSKSRKSRKAKKGKKSRK